MNRGNIRILYINDFLNGGGAEVVLSQLMDGVRDEGFSVELFYGEESNASAAVNPFSYIYSRKYRNKLLKMLWEYKPHVIHILNYYHILTPSILDALKAWKKENPGTRVIHTAHDFHLLCPSSGLTSYPFCSGRLKREPPGRIQDRASLWLKRWDHRGILYSSLKAAQWAAAYRFSQKDAVIDTIICPGRFMFESMQKVFPDKSVHFIRNPYPGKAAAEKASGKKGDRLKLVFAGRIAQEKGLIPFLQSVSPDTWNYLSFDIYGTGPLMKEVKKIVERLPRTAQCRVMGGRKHEDIQEALPFYHMLVLPRYCMRMLPCLWLRPPSPVCVLQFPPGEEQGCWQNSSAVIICSILKNRKR